jgi:hypothetical protein
MADASGLRQRRKGGTQEAGGSPDIDARTSEDVDQDQENDDNYGYAESDAEDDQDVRTQPAPAPAAEAQHEGSSSEEEQYDDDEEEAEDIYANARPPPAYLLDEPQPTDHFILLAGFSGFFLSLVCAALLVRYERFSCMLSGVFNAATILLQPSFGVNQDYVMAAGMLSLLFFVMWLSFCPSLRTQKQSLTEVPAGQLSPIEQISPGPVFIVTACIGTMIGGLIGGGVQHAWPAMHR